MATGAETTLVNNEAFLITASIGATELASVECGKTTTPSTTVARASA